MSRHKDAIKAATAKALAWFRRPDLTTPPQVIQWDPPEAAVLIGRIVAIEYYSDKFDGTPRVYRHDFTKMRDLAVSPDGSTLIVIPPFRVTTRGIEG